MFKKSGGYLVLMIIIIFLLSSVSCSSANVSQRMSSNIQSSTKDTSGSIFAKNRRNLAEKITDNSLLVLFSERNGYGTVTEGKDDSPDRKNIYRRTD